MEDVIEQQRLLYGQPPVYVRQLYILVILLLAGLMASLLFVTVDVVAVCPAITRQNGETIPIHSRRAGIIDSVYIRNGDSVNAGEKIAKLNDEVCRKKLLTLRKECDALEFQVGRLEMLGHFASQYPFVRGNVNVDKSDKQYQLFMANHSAWSVKLNKAGADLKLSRVLHNDNIIAPADLAAAENKFQEINTAFRAFIDGQLASWEKEGQVLSERLSKLKMDIFSAEKEYESHYILSPITGIVSGLNGRVESDNIVVEDVFCFVSPFDSLVVESYVTPTAMVYLSVGQPVYYSLKITGMEQVKMTPGKIVVVSPVMDWNSGQLVYRVLSSMPSPVNNSNEENGFRLVAGIVLKSRFLVTKRKVWQLLVGRLRHFSQPVSVIK